MSEILEDKMSPEFIQRRISEHLTANQPHRSRARIVRNFLSAFVQNAAMTPEELAITKDDDELDSGIQAEG